MTGIFLSLIYFIEHAINPANSPTEVKDLLMSCSPNDILGMTIDAFMYLHTRTDIGNKQSLCSLQFCW